jgi:hypothetical protein
MHVRTFVKILAVMATLVLSFSAAGAGPRLGVVIEGRAAESDKAKPSKKKKKEKEPRVGFSAWSEQHFHRCYLVMLEPPEGETLGVQVMADAPVFSEDQNPVDTGDAAVDRPVYFAFSFEVPRGFLEQDSGSHSYTVANEQAEQDGGDFDYEVEFDDGTLTASRRVGNGTALEEELEILFDESLEPLELSLLLSRNAVASVKIKHCAFGLPTGEGAEAGGEDDAAQARAEETESE